METSKIIRAAAYCRVSTNRDVQDGSFELQREHFAKFVAERPEMRLIGIYGDSGRSGRAMKDRPELTRLLADCEAGKIDLILTKSVSRFARNLLECVETVRRLSEIGVGILFEKEALDTRTAKGELVLGFLAAIAQEESASISRNLQWGRRKRLERGHVDCPARYGYVAVGAERRWEIVEREAAIVRQAFYMAGTGSLYPEIVATLTRMEREGGSARVWNRIPVRNMLRSRVYIGDYLSNQKCAVMNLDGCVKTVPNSGQVEQFLIEGHHSAIVGRKLFYAVQSVLDARLLWTRREPLSKHDREIAATAKALARKEAARWRSITSK